MFLKKMDSLSVISDYLLLLWTVCLCSFCSFGQSTANSYENLWKVIQTDTVSNEKKIQYLDVYYQKARTENNQLEQYRALEKKTYLVPFADAAVLLHQIDRKSTRLNSSHVRISYAVFCLKKKKKKTKK